MSPKTIQTRIASKSDTTQNWEKNPNFVPFLGEICIYTNRFTNNNISIPGVKIGDGINYIKDLPFIDTEINERITLLIEDIDQKLDYTSEIDCGTWS